MAIKLSASESALFTKCYKVNAQLLTFQYHPISVTAHKNLTFTQQIECGLVAQFRTSIRRIRDQK